MTVTARPQAPPRAGRFLVHLGAAVVGAGVVGAITGPLGVAYGAGIGLVLWVVLERLGLLDARVDLAALLVAGAVAGAIFEWGIDRRTGSIRLDESILASLGWVLFGAALGGLLLRRKAGLGRAVVLAGMVGFGAGALVALQWGVVLGFLPELSNAAPPDAVQELTRYFYGAVGAIIAFVGGGLTLSAYLGTPTLAAVAGTSLFTLFSAANVGFSFAKVLEQIPVAWDFIQAFWPPDWDWAADKVPGPFIETVQVAVVGATIGCSIAIPVAFMASRATTYNGAAYWINRSVMNVLRTVPDLFWAMIFVAAVGFNAFAGALAMIAFSFGIMTKLFSETIDAIEMGPLEAIRAAGARHSQVVQYGAAPQVLPNYVAYFLYIFEINIRASAVLGIVGAGGIGRLLEEQRALFAWDRMIAIILVIYGGVLIIELVSTSVRRRLV